MPRKPGQQTRTAVLSAFWATRSGQRERTARYALIATAGLRGERPYRPMGGLAKYTTTLSTHKFESDLITASLYLNLTERQNHPTIAAWKPVNTYGNRRIGLTGNTI